MVQKAKAKQRVGDSTCAHTFVHTCNVCMHVCVCLELVQTCAHVCVCPAVVSVVASLQGLRQGWAEEVV